MGKWRLYINYYFQPLQFIETQLSLQNHKPYCIPVKYAPIITSFFDVHVDVSKYCTTPSVYQERANLGTNVNYSSEFQSIQNI